MNQRDSSTGAACIPFRKSEHEEQQYGPTKTTNRPKNTRLFLDMQAAVKGMFALLILTKSHGALDWCDTDRLTTQKRCRVSEVNDGTNRQILNPQPKLPDTREANI
jgi:hypothetical protein